MVGCGLLPCTAVTPIAVGCCGTSDHLLLMAQLLHSLLSDDVQILVLSLWLDVRSLTTLDVAVSSRRLRPNWLTVLRCLRSGALDNWDHSRSSLMWLAKRGIRASRVQMKMDKSLVRGCDILLVDTSDIVHIGLGGCHHMTDQCVVDIVNRCVKLRSIDIGGCGQVTDAGMIALGHGCGQLRSIDLTCCHKVTDAGVIALGAGCGQLQSINVESCDKVTDAGVIALGAGCGQLQSIDLAGCNKVTDAGVIALGAGCGQLQSIDLVCCNKVTDAGVIALGAGCGQLQSINVHGCDEVTDASVIALRHTGIEICI